MTFRDRTMNRRRFLSLAGLTLSGKALAAPPTPPVRPTPALRPEPPAPVVKKATVPAPRGTFRNPVNHGTHRCPACGYQSPPGTGTWAIRGYASDGKHLHACPCGEVWKH